MSDHEVDTLDVLNQARNTVRGNLDRARLDYDRKRTVAEAACERITTLEDVLGKIDQAIKIEETEG
jgi:hypothetical protein